MTRSEPPASVTEFLPCPFCGGEAAMHENDYCEPPEWSAYCLNLECQAHAHSSVDRDFAIAAWNRRALRSEPPAEVVEAADIVERLRVVLAKLEREGDMVIAQNDCRWLQDSITEIERLRASSSLGGIEGGVARPQTACAPDEPLITGNAIGDIAAERRRHVEAEGWSPEHDDEHSNGEMAMAAVCYALSSADSIISPNTALGALWPWGWEWWKPTKPRRDLVKSAALIVAEIERLDRAAKRSA